MAIDPVWIWVALGVVALLVVVALFARGARKTQTEALRENYGREYDHAVNEAGSRKKAERELLERKREVDQFDIRPLTAAERDRYRGDWKRVEQHFLERPTTAVVEADEIVADIMRVQGYPMGDFEKHAAHLSVKHPRVVEHYRAGHKVMDGTPGSASTEDLRQSMLHYRALFDELIGDTSGDVVRDMPRQNEVVSAPTPTTREAVERERALREVRDDEFSRKP